MAQAGGRYDRGDEPLFEISTDKVDTEVPSPVAGHRDKILVPEGKTVAVGTELAEIDSGDGAAAARGHPCGRRRRLRRRPRSRGSRGLHRGAGPHAPSRSARGPSPGGRRGTRLRRCRTGARGRRSCRRWCGNSPPNTTWICHRSPEQAPVAASPSTMWKPPSPPAAHRLRRRRWRRTGPPTPVAPSVAVHAGPRRRDRAAHAHPQGDRRAHGRLARHLRACLDDGRGQHRAPREAPRSA